MTTARPVLGTYAPAPGSVNGLADYAVMSSRRISSVVDVRFVFLAEYRSPEQFDLVLYHVGCGRESVAALRALDLRPGPVVLHEHVLNQFFVENHDLLDEATNATVRAVFDAALGGPPHTSAELADLMAADRSLQYLDLGLERLVVERATVVFTHSRQARSTLRARYPSADVRLLEFPVEPLDRSGRDGARAHLQIPPSAVAFGSFGFVGGHKRLPQVLRAWRRLAAAPSTARLVLLGRGTDRFGASAPPGVMLFGEVHSGDEFRRLFSALDVGVQLRGPTLGETSGVVAQMLAGDLPVIVSSEGMLPTWANPALVRVVPPGPDEEVQLARAMAALLHPVRARGRRDDPGQASWRSDILAALGLAPAAAAVGEDA